MTDAEHHVGEEAAMEAFRALVERLEELDEEIAATRLHAAKLQAVREDVERRIAALASSRPRSRARAPQQSPMS